MDWFPLVFIVFKILVFGSGMFLAIKWHHERAKKERRGGSHASLGVVIKAVAVFVVVLVGLLLVTFFVSQKLGLNLNFP